MFKSILDSIARSVVQEKLRILPISTDGIRARPVEIGKIRNFSWTTDLAIELRILLNIKEVRRIFIY